MKEKDVKVGGVYETKIGQHTALVEVVSVKPGTSYNPRTRFSVRRVGEGTVLPKARTAAALHEVEQKAWR